MSRRYAQAMAYDAESFEDEAPTAPERALIRCRDGVLRAVDVARLAWPDETAAAGVDYMADLARQGALGRC